eukprot:441449-Prorocentrum_minimum.AAC.1
MGKSPVHMTIKSDAESVYVNQGPLPRLLPRIGHQHRELPAIRARAEQQRRKALPRPRREGSRYDGRVG